MPGVETKSNKAHGALELDFSSTNQNAIEHTELLGSQSGEGEDGEGTPPPGNDFPPLIQHLPAPLEAGKQPSRTIGILGLAILSYVAVCGGERRSDTLESLTCRGVKPELTISRVIQDHSESSKLWELQALI